MSSQLTKDQVFGVGVADPLEVGDICARLRTPTIVEIYEPHNRIGVYLEKHEAIALRDWLNMVLQ